MRLRRLGQPDEEIRLWLARAAAACAHRFESAALPQRGTSPPGARDALLALQLMGLPARSITDLVTNGAVTYLIER